MKMKVRKIVALLLCLALCMGISVTAMAVEGTGISLSLNETEAVVGSIPETITMTVSTENAVIPVSIWGEAYVSDGTINGITISEIKDGDKELSAASTTTGRFAWMSPANTKSFTKWAEVVFTLPSNLPAGTYTFGVKEMGAKDKNENSLLSATTKTVTFTVKAPKALSGISVTTPPTKTSYVAGQNFDSTGMKLTATYNDGTTETITSGWTITDGNNLTAGKTSVTISYTEGDVTKTTTQDITVVAKEVSSIAVKTQPTKTAYKVGEEFEPAGLVITVTYNDGSNEDITDGFDWNPKGELKANDKVTISFGGKTITLKKVTVKSNENEPGTHKHDSGDVIVIKGNDTNSSNEYNPDTGASIISMGVIAVLAGAAYVASKKRK